MSINKRKIKMAKQISPESNQKKSNKGGIALAIGLGVATVLVGLGATACDNGTTSGPEQQLPDATRTFTLSNGKTVTINNVALLASNERLDLIEKVCNNIVLVVNGHGSIIIKSSTTGDVNVETLGGNALAIRSGWLSTVSESDLGDALLIELSTNGWVKANIFDSNIRLANGKEATVEKSSKRLALQATQGCLSPNFPYPGAKTANSV
jgi:hypothetical protein